MELKHGPWRIKKKEIIYKNPWVEVEEDKVIRPDGMPGIFSVVKLSEGVSILPIDDKGYVYLVEEFKYALGTHSIEAVSGAIDDGETSLEAAKRELLEELGIFAKEFVYMGFVDPFTSNAKSRAYLFLAKVLEFGDHTREGTETIKPLKMKLEDAINLVVESKITHAQSCVLILKARDWLAKPRVKIEGIKRKLYQKL